jgi:Transposase zinc-binding domain
MHVAKPKLYNPRHPERTLLYQTIAQHYESWLELVCAGQLNGQGDHHTPKPYVRQAFRKYLECGIFARARCDDCGHNYFLAFSCKGRGVCPSCNTRRMVQTAAHLTDHVFPRLGGAPVGVVGAKAAALLHAARWAGTEHGAAYLPAGHRAKPICQQPRCGEYGQGSAAPRVSLRRNFVVTSARSPLRAGVTALAAPMPLSTA